MRETCNGNEVSEEGNWEDSRTINKVCRSRTVCVGEDYNFSDSYLLPPVATRLLPSPLEQEARALTDGALSLCILPRRSVVLALGTLLSELLQLGQSLHRSLVPLGYSERM